MKKQIFYVLHLTDTIFRDCLEAIRFLCDPLTKHPAHITVRGPYVKKISIDKINYKFSRTPVLIDGVDTFFDSGQNTVFFVCSCPELKTVWKKSDYPFNPHLTISDCGPRSFARRVFETVNKYQYRMHVGVTELKPLLSTKQANFSVSLTFNRDLISRILNHSVNPNDICNIAENERLEMIDRISQYLSKYSNSRTITIEKSSRPSI